MSLHLPCYPAAGRVRGREACYNPLGVQGGYLPRELEQLPQQRPRHTHSSGRWVDNKPFREAFEKSGLTTSDLARRIGWTRKNYGKVKCEPSRVERLLGLKYHLNEAGYKTIKRSMTYENALLICEALGLDPVDMGL